MYIQNISNYIPNLNLRTIAKTIERGVGLGINIGLEMGINFLAHVGMQRRIFPVLHLSHTLVDVTILNCIKVFYGTSLSPSFKSDNISEMLSCGFAISLIGAYRFATDPSYGLIDMAALTLSSSFFFLKHGIIFFEKRQRDKHENLLRACRHNDIAMVEQALNEGGNPFSGIYSPIGSSIQLAFDSQNTELILLLLEKTRDGYQKVWNSIFNTINWQRHTFPSANRVFSSLLTFYSHPEDFFSKVFIDDNLTLFKKLWEKASTSIKNQGSEILKFALRLGAGDIAKFLLSQGITIPELENIKEKYKDHNLDIHNFLPICILGLNGLNGIVPVNANVWKHYLALTNISSKDLQDKTGIDYLTLLDELVYGKYTIWEMAVYLGLQAKKEDFYEKDLFGLRPLDYAISCSEGCGNGFFHFLMKTDKNLMFLGERHTSLHLAILARNNHIFRVLLNNCEEYFSKRKKDLRSSTIDLWRYQGKIHLQPSWGKKEFINRLDSFCLTPLHYVFFAFSGRNYKEVDLLLKAGAEKDIRGKILKGESTIPFPPFLIDFMKEEFPSLENEELQSLSLSSIDLVEEMKRFLENSTEEEHSVNGLRRINQMIQLLKGEKTLADIEAEEQ